MRALAFGQRFFPLTHTICLSSRFRQSKPFDMLLPITKKNIMLNWHRALYFTLNIKIKQTNASLRVLLCLHILHIVFGIQYTTHYKQNTQFVFHSEHCTIHFMLHAKHSALHKALYKLQALAFTSRLSFSQCCCY